MTEVEDPQGSEESGILRPMPVGVQLGLWAVLMVCSIGVPAAHIQTSTHHAFRGVQFLSAAAIVAVVAALVGGLVGWLKRDATAGLMSATVTVVVVFWWGILTGVSASLAGALPLLSTDLAVVLLAAILVGGAAKWGRTWIVGSALFLLVGGTAGAVVSEVATLNTMPQEVGSVVTSIGDAAELPNVLIVVLDGHPRADQAEAVFNFDLSEFVSATAALGFETADDAWTNYNTSYASTSAMLALDNLVASDRSVADMWDSIRAVSGGDGEFLRAFERAGYDVSYSVSAWFGSRCGEIVDRCFRYEVFPSSLYWLGRASIAAALVPSLMDHPWTLTSEAQLRDLANVHAVSTAAGGPAVIWAHVVVPHPPVGLDAQCEVLRDPWRSSFFIVEGDEHDADRRNAFKEQMTCVHQLILDEVGAIIERDPDAVVVLLSDHGPDGQGQHAVGYTDLDESQLREKFAVLRSIRAPDSCGAASVAATSIESLRALVACVLDADVPQGPVPAFLTPGEISLSESEPPVPIDLDDL